MIFYHLLYSVTLDLVSYCLPIVLDTPMILNLGFPHISLFYVLQLENTEAVKVHASKTMIIIYGAECASV